MIHEAISSDGLFIEEAFLAGYKYLPSYLSLSLFLSYLSQAAHLSYFSFYISLSSPSRSEKHKQESNVPARWSIEGIMTPPKVSHFFMGYIYISWLEVQGSLPLHHCIYTPSDHAVVSLTRDSHFLLCLSFIFAHGALLRQPLCTGPA